MSVQTAATWADYDALPEDVKAEWIDGGIVIGPRPNKPHQQACHRLTTLLEQAVGPGWDVTVDWSWKPAADEFHPDVMLTAKTDELVRFSGMPELCVEVLSTNRAHDLVRKAAKYAALGLPRYWILDPVEESLAAYELVGGVYEPAQEAVGEQEREFDAGPAKLTISPAALLRI